MEKLHLIREEKDDLDPELGKMMPHFQTCGFPLRKPRQGYLVHARHDGDRKISITADPQYGMPFGADVLTLLWCFTEALKTGNRTIHFKAAAKILKKMQLSVAGSNYRAIIKSFERIFGCKYTFEWWEPVPGKGKRRHIKQALLFDELVVWFNEDGQLPLEGEGFENVIVLSEFAWNWLQRRARWFATEPAYALRQIPGAIQLYLMIVSRGPALRGPGDCCEIPISGPEGLDQQIGGETYEGREGQKRWRQLLRKWLGAIKILWPECPVELVDLTGCTRYGKEKKGWYLRIDWFPQPVRRLP